MECLVGVILAVSVSAFGTLVGFDRGRSFYPAMLIVIASYYALFAIMGGSSRSLLVESCVIAISVLLAVLGFKFNLWLIVVALIAHGVFDFVHGYLVRNPGVPQWWPMFCLTYDVTAGAYLALLLRLKRPTQKVL